MLIVGAGAQGGPCASILARDKDISQIVLADTDIDLANRVKAKIKSSKLNTMKVDAGKIDIIERLRNEKQFDTADELKKQMAEDIKQGRAILNSRGRS